MVSTYWLEDLAAECCQRYAPTVTKVAALRDVFAIREKPSRFERLSSFQRILVGAAIVIGVLSAVIPKEAFEVFKGGDNAYDWVRAVIAAGVLSLALYMGALTVPWTERERAARRRRKAAPLISTVLSTAQSTHQLRPPVRPSTLASTSSQDNREGLALDAQSNDPELTAIALTDRVRSRALSAPRCLALIAAMPTLKNALMNFGVDAL